MNPDTGEIREFADGVIPKGWIEWNLGEEVTIKGCNFRVVKINIAENTIKLKGIGDTEVR